MSKMERNKIALRQARASVVRHASDCGSSEVQGARPGAANRLAGGCACSAAASPAPATLALPSDAFVAACTPASAVSILTRRIAYMTEHLQAHRKDNHSRLGLMGMLANRKKLLKYLRRTDGDRYGLIITKLGLKDKE
jgi:small subunit ribosomal protein S15